MTFVINSTAVQSDGSITVNVTYTFADGTTQAVPVIVQNPQNPNDIITQVTNTGNALQNAESQATLNVQIKQQLDSAVAASKAQSIPLATALQNQAAPAQPAPAQT